MFHEHRELITELRQNDTHFQRVFDRHNDLDHEIIQLEATHAAQLEIDTLKKEKLKLKDEIYALIVKNKK